MNISVNRIPHDCSVADPKKSLEKHRNSLIIEIAPIRDFRLLPELTAIVSLTFFENK